VRRRLSANKGTLEGGVVGEDLAVDLEFIVFDFLRLDLLCRCFFLDESAAHLSAPLHYRVHAQKSDVAAALNQGAVDQEVIFHNVELVIGKSLFSLPEDKPVAHFQTAVVLELLDSCLQRLSLLFFVLGQPDQGGQPARPHCALLQVDLRNDVLEELAADVLLPGLPADDSQNLEMDAVVVGGRQELGELTDALGLRLPA